MQKTRVGGLAGVASKYLARKDADVLAVIGSGWQATAQVEAHCHARPSIREVRVYSPNAQRCEAFAAEMAGKVKAKVKAVASAEAAVRGRRDCRHRHQLDRAGAVRQLARARNVHHLGQGAGVRGRGLCSLRSSHRQPTWPDLVALCGRRLTDHRRAGTRDLGTAGRRSSGNRCGSWGAWSRAASRGAPTTSRSSPS